MIVDTASPPPPTIRQVSTINPGFHRTEINHNAAETLRVAFERAPKEVQAEYGEEYLQVK